MRYFCLDAQLHVKWGNDAAPLGRARIESAKKCKKSSESQGVLKINLIDYKLSRVAIS